MSINLGTVYYKPEDTYYHYMYNTVERTEESPGVERVRCWHHRNLEHYGHTINFPTGYVDFRLGYPNGANPPYSYTYLREQLSSNLLTYYRESKNQLYNTDNNDYQGHGNHTFTYEVDHSDANWNYYKIYSDQYIEVHDDDGQGGGGAYQAYYESTMLLAVPLSTSYSDTVGYINSYIVEGQFAADVHDSYYYASYVGGLTKDAQTLYLDYWIRWW